MLKELKTRRCAVAEYKAHCSLVNPSRFFNISITSLQVKMTQHHWEHNEVGITVSNSYFSSYGLKKNIFCKAYLELASSL